MVVGVDPSDHRIKVSEGVVWQEDKKFTFVNRFDDYREHEGYWFPHQLTNVSLGLEVGRSTLQRVEVNPELEDDTFLPTEMSSPSPSN